MDVKPNITEVELGSPDYKVVPLNAREKRLLKAPSSAHYHRLLLETLDTVRLSHQEVRRHGEGWSNGTPYEATFEYGWSEGESAAFLLQATYRFRMAPNGSVQVDEKRTNVIDGPGLAACLYQLDKITERDLEGVLQICSTVATNLEAKVRECLRASEQRLQSDDFQSAFHGWVRERMKAEMRFDLKPLLSRYPAEALSEILNEFVVEEIHET